MAYAVQLRRGSAVEHATFTGTEGEITVNTTDNTLVVHDGTTVGGHPLTPGADGAAGVSAVSLRQGGTLATITGTEKWYAPGNITITKIAARLGTVANGSTVTTVNKNGNTQKTMTIPSGSAAVVDTNNLFTMSTSDFLTINVTSVAASPGADLNIQIVYTYD
jgi:hypothetical protein